MAAANLPPELIRYSSYDRIAHGRSSRFTPRMIAYSTALVALIAVTGYLMGSRTDVETTILRTSGRIYEVLDDGWIRNLYTVKIVNKTPNRLQLDLSLKDSTGRLQVMGPELAADGYEGAESVFTVEMPPEELLASTSLLTIQVKQGERVLEEVRTTFSAPEQSWP
jgi:polyferredoxin